MVSFLVELQIEKSRNLVEGLRKHLNGIGGGVTKKEQYPTGGCCSLYLCG
jgi:hypothetical protein